MTENGSLSLSLPLPPSLPPLFSFSLSLPPSFPPPFPLSLSPSPTPKGNRCLWLRTDTASGSKGMLLALLMIF